MPDDQPQVEWDGDDTVEIDATIEDVDDVMSVFYEQLGSVLGDVSQGGDVRGRLTNPVHVDGSLTVTRADNEGDVE